MCPPHHSPSLLISHPPFAYSLADPRYHLELTLKGVQRVPPRSGDSRLPITLIILSLLGHTFAQAPNCYDHLMLWSACCMGFFAFTCMRSGELIMPAGWPLIQAKHLYPTNVAVDNIADPPIMCIHLQDWSDSSRDWSVCTCRSHTQLQLFRWFAA